MDGQTFEIIRNLCYLVASVLFIFGIKGLTSPRTAVRGNMLVALGMLLAAIATLIGQGIGPAGWAWIAAGVVVGGGLGYVMAIRVKMTAMPEMVGFFNGFGGAASFLVAGAILSIEYGRGTPLTGQSAVATIASGLIGGVTLSGSLVAVGKLQEMRWLDKFLFPGQKTVNGTLLILAVAFGVVLMFKGGAPWTYWVIVAIALMLGIFLTTPIGGADMPVVIALLNSYSGLAAAATGFVIDNNVLIIAGSLVGASGLILTKIMCVAMNRSLANVLFGGMGVGEVSGPSADDVYGGKVKSASPEEVAILFDTAQKALIVPGYGMAVAQAQHVVRDLAKLLESRGVSVDYGIHPVAGRMPGHMNVLLAEADVAYEKLKEMDDVNATMEQIDVVMVIGANDVVNPVARTDPDSPIAGMPIIDVDKARTVVVVKRSLSPGFAGIPNPLFAADNTLMMFGDGQKAILELIAALKES